MVTTLSDAPRLRRTRPAWSTGTLLALLLVSGGIAACKKPATAWQVLDGGELVLTFAAAPGPLVSTALPPPGARPVEHPFISGAARSARHEDRLRKILDASADADDFIARLRAARFEVRPNDSK